MCGIAGIVDRGGCQPGEVEHIAAAMAGALRHRGPDDQGVWTDESAAIALGHRRLAVIDLSPTGRQPMVSPSGRFVVVYNGEVYNFLVLREQLEGRGHSFRGSSDTEVLLAAVEEWGLTGALRCLNGMFAFALWDRVESRLHLARDRLGEKPLYYGWAGRDFVFGSEIRALRAAPQFDSTIDHSALALLLRHKYIPAPYSPFAHIKKLLPGTTVCVEISRTIKVGEPRAYWSARDAADGGLSRPNRSTEADLVDELDGLLSDAVSQRMISDVPLGAFLSGGIDSSTVVSLMTEQSNRPVRTFTMGFEDPQFDEANRARAVAEHLGTDHTEVFVTSKDALSVVPKLSAIYDEPFADPSQIPTFLVCGLARAEVTVALSGDGGDELFGGYPRYRLGRRLWQAIDAIPLPARQASSRWALGRPGDTVKNALDRVRPLLPRPLRDRSVAWLFEALGRTMSHPSRELLYEAIVSDWHDPLAAVPMARPLATALNDPKQWLSGGFVDHMMYIDAVSYLPDDILTKVDRASMAVSLETRLPLLDHRVFEFAWTLPLALRFDPKKSKRILKEVLYRHVPRPLVDHPKRGFGVPLASWLRGDLREWASDLLSPSALIGTGVFDARMVRDRWTEHQSGRRNWHYVLWSVLIAQAWLTEQRSHTTV